MRLPWKEAKKKVLVVEDEPAARALMVTALGKDNYQISEAADGRAALDLAFSEVPDLVVMDIMLPRLSGFDATHAIRSNPKTRHVPVLMCTVRDTVADFEKSIAWGANDFLSKPYEVSRLRAKVEKLLQR